MYTLLQTEQKVPGKNNNRNFAYSYLSMYLNLIIVHIIKIIQCTFNTTHMINLITYTKITYTFMKINFLLEINYLLIFSMIHQ